MRDRKLERVSAGASVKAKVSIGMRDSANDSASMMDNAKVTVRFIA